MKIEVVAYREEWPDLFESEKQLLTSALPPAFFEFFHIGSTSVKGLAAKPIIDILMVVDDLSYLDAHASVFEAHGYEVCGEFGMLGRRYYRKGGDQRTHHIHAFKFDNLYDIGRHLAVRDYLRTHAEAVIEYGDIKKEAAKFAENDIEKYGDFKDACVKNIEEKALKWSLKNKAKDNDSNHDMSAVE